MSYRVIWSSMAEQILSTEFFLAHETGRDTDVLELAVFEVNELLSDQPEDVGESRDGLERILFVGPLIVKYEIYELRGVVSVYDVIVRYRR